MKKILAVALTFVMIIGLFTACGKSSNQNSNGSETKLVHTVELSSEDYGVGFRKGSGLAVLFNNFFVSNYETFKNCAEKYNVADILAEQPTYELGSLDTNGDSDVEYVKNKGKLVVGITEFEPMDYKDANGNWIGFDADMATAFAKEIGVDVEFVLIDWDNKIMELNGKSIDCVWNGMTLTDEVKSSMECSIPYCSNKQVVVVRADVADKYQTVEACKDLSFAVEAGSAGENVAKDNGYKYTAVKDQATALMEVRSGTSDAAIIDLTMAKAMIDNAK